MDVTAASATAQSQGALAFQASVAATRKAVDVTSQQDASLVALIDQTNGIGQNLNVTA